MRWLSTITSLLVSSFALGGCAMDVGDGASESIESSEHELAIKGITFPQETPTTLTLYSEAGFWGTSYTAQIMPSGNNETVNMITRTQIEAAGLLDRVSSLRLTCGSRGAHVMLYNSYNTGTTLDSWSEYGTGRPVYCTPGQTVTVELHQQIPELADRVSSIYFLNHARQAKLAGFSSFVTTNWNAALQDLPDGASANGPPRFRLTGASTFKLRQNLTLDDWKCGDRAAHFVLTAYMYQDRTFSVYVTESYVDTGWGDAWGCRDKMKSALAAGARDAAAQLRGGLQSLLQIVGTHPRYYFYPAHDLSQFDVAGGGESGIIVNLPPTTGVFQPL
ncbi:MAG TPA: hypothetical protein VK524_15520 [Polyangiaceae bacterium]|nr:hypothetical protein [Polyangiaceae bacterium]